LSVQGASSTSNSDEHVEQKTHVDDTLLKYLPRGHSAVSTGTTQTHSGEA
jgi:hypothetical protein